MSTFTSNDFLPVDFSKFYLNLGIGMTDGPFATLSESQSSFYVSWHKNFIGIYDNSLTIRGSWQFGPNIVLGRDIGPWIAITSGTVTSYEYTGFIADGPTKTSFKITGFEVPAKNMGQYFAKPELYIFNGDDLISGSNVNDVLWGYSGNDKIYGRGGIDVITGGAGDDFLDGGDGLDVAGFSGGKVDYSWTLTSSGWVVKDLRPGSPDGVDTLINIERLGFSDGVFDLPAPDASTATASASILRMASSSLPVDFAIQVGSGAMAKDDGLKAILAAADATTSVASMSYQFFTGKVPSQGGVDFLVSPTGPNTTNLNSAYYAKFDTVNRYINFAVNLGKNGEAKDTFAAKYGSLSLFDATKEAYKAIFGAVPTDAKVHALVDGRVDYLAYYGGDGANGIGTKAAMVGFLLAAAAIEDVGVMARSNDAWLIDLSDGSAPFAVDILDPAKGYYKADFIFGG